MAATGLGVRWLSQSPRPFRSAATEPQALHQRAKVWVGGDADRVPALTQRQRDPDERMHIPRATDSDQQDPHG